MTAVLEECELMTENELAEVADLQLPDTPKANELLTEATKSYENRLAACRTVLAYLASGDMAPWDSLKVSLAGDSLYQKAGFPQIETPSSPDDLVRNARIMCRTLIPIFQVRPDEKALVHALEALRIIRVIYYYD
jgi:hypothetical protein